MKYLLLTLEFQSVKVENAKITKIQFRKLDQEEGTRLCVELTQLSYTKCSMQDSECLIREGQALLSQFVNGIPESHVEKLDEMFIDTIEINTDGIDHELQNVKISGLRNAKINDISFDNNFKMMRLSFDANLTTNSEYTLDGVLFRQPIVGAGTTTYTIKNIQMDMLILYDIVKNENGKHTLKIRRYRSGFTIKDGVEYQYNNLFNGDKQKNEVVHALLNKNWVTITGVFGNKFYYKIFDKIFEAIKAFARSHYLEDLFFYLSYFVVALQLSSILGAPQLSYTKCSMQDSECLIREGQALLNQFVNGIPESHVEKLDEMFVDTIEINTDGVDYELQNVKISGLRNAKINDISFDNTFKIMRLSFDANLTMNSEYTLDGVLFRRPMVGAGTTTYTIKNIQMDMLILYDIVKNENGKHTLKIRRYRSGFTIKDGVEYQVNNLFDGDKQKSRRHKYLTKSPTPRHTFPTNGPANPFNIETRSMKRRIGPLPAGDHRSTPGAGTGRLSIRTVSGEELNRRAPTGSSENATANTDKLTNRTTPTEPYSPSTISYTPSIPSSPLSKSNLPTPTLDVAWLANALLPKSTKADLILKELSNCINKCLQTGTFPNSLKVAKVSPIYKSGSKLEPGNYRPISVLPVISKIFERVIYNRLETYLTSIKFFYDKQYGFRPKSNTLSATIDLITNIKLNIDKKQIVLGVFIDLKKAFDTVSHELLLKKLFDIGLTATAYGMLKSYLSNRTQVVQIGKIQSSSKSINFGVPQGSILGPLLFTIYINSISGIGLTGDVTLYGDDTCLFYSGRSINDLIAHAQKYLDSLNVWFQCNLLTINISKTKYMIFASMQKIKKLKTIVH
ncbi:unnamed protein product [Euphydryas editha]|uniref:Reverse transcriptase domain-containing protein n=1 Tax=Euphydryas editha TaxID=104508 RepID=A0AAU9TD75_EUPED|nr:unnamed protein product [Euphydryas editha]